MRALDHVEQGVLTLLVTGGPGQAALGGPAAVAVHDDRDVPRDEVGRHVGWGGAGRVRVGCAHRCPDGLLAGPAHPSPFADVRQGSQAALEVPGDVRRDETARLPAVPLLRGIDHRPVTGQQGAEQCQGLHRGTRGPGHPAGRRTATHPPRD